MCRIPALMATLVVLSACTTPGSGSSSASGSTSSSGGQGSSSGGSSASSATASSGGSSGGGSSSAAASSGGVDAGVPTFLGPPGAEASNALCSNMVDEDTNGYADCADYWCRDSVAVTVCGALENSVSTCTDMVDNPESPGNPSSAALDGLVDCQDPDCFKNPALVGVCPALRFETGADCQDDQDNDGDGLKDCADPDCLHAGASTCPRTRTRVLFDDAHRERAGSADWVVDTAGPHPWPSVPVVETDWAGNLSSFGKELVDTGRFTVETLGALNGALTYQDASNAQDLSQFDVLVLPEPSAPLADAESDAVLAFIQAGGGVLMVADHFESDRDGNNWDSVQVFNAMLTRMGNGVLENNPLGFSVALTTYAESGAIQSINNRTATTVAADQASHPVLAGTHGTVTRVGMYRGGLFVTYGPAATVLMHAMPLTTPGYTAGSPYVLAAESGSGKVVAVGDSAILNDGTDSHGLASPSFDSWHDGTVSNAALILNAVEWLAQ